MTRLHQLKPLRMPIRSAASYTFSQPVRDSPTTELARAAYGPQVLTYRSIVPDRFFGSVFKRSITFGSLKLHALFG